MSCDAAKGKKIYQRVYLLYIRASLQSCVDRWCCVCTQDVVVGTA